MLFLALTGEQINIFQQCVCLMSRNRSVCNEVDSEEIGHCFGKPVFFAKKALFGSREQINIFQQTMHMSDVEELFRMQ